MALVVIYIIVLVVLFGAAFLSRRRFGVLGLGLAAGSVLSGYWANELSNYLQSNGVTLEAPVLLSVTAAILVLLPSLVLISNGPTYRSIRPRVIGSLLFASLAVAFLIQPLESLIILEGDALRVYELFTKYRVYIITAGLIAAVVDLMLTRTPKVHHDKGKH